ncbi:MULTISPECIES: hypothetical protein [unclassified Mesorhizobium]|uniref:hypothetical protein n=1 Tax=unclassified Mesorhizobium TaxID=325217 RepID=UPI00112B4D97|nr:MULTISPECIES: hypothetical protein [unclassified Mesorhizobium]TPI19383.1 hypothetical protein FJW10_14620 [Mesorhizobium sp. B4-1-1]TPL49676.1 hypothetical protein FJ957_11420 [Mesorhizobium sp. B2-4-6]
MIMPHVSKSGVAYPDDLVLLKRIYDQLCEERGIVAGSSEASDLAIEAMKLFSAGVFDEETICRRLRGRIGDGGGHSPSP